MCRGLFVLLISGLVGHVTAAPPPVITRQPADAPVTNDQLQAGIERLQRELYFQQDRQTGSWERHGRRAATECGRTALAVHALLSSGQTPQYEPLGRAIQWLRKIRPTTTYEAAVRAHVWASLPRDDRVYLEAETMWLLNAHDGHSRFRYEPGSSSFDHSCTQYALLGLWEASKRKTPVPLRFWQDAQSHFIAAQELDGGWGYQPGSSSTGSMTAAGLTALLITREQMYRARRKPPPELTDAIDMGLAWLDEHFDANRNIASDGATAGHYYYYLYSVERVAMASGVKFLDRQDWYQRGARAILNRIDEYALAQPRADAQPDRLPTSKQAVIEASFALLFLSRGRVGTWITKLKLPDHPWNDRPNDINLLTRYLSDLRETELNWQMMSVDRPGRQMITAPLAYLSMAGQFELSEAQLNHLREYLDLGGMLVLSPQSQSGAFQASAARLARRLYPHRSMRPLGPDHPIYQSLFPIRFSKAPPLSAVSNGVREVVILTGTDWSTSFQTPYMRHRGRPWQLAANLYTFVSDQGRLPGRLALPWPAKVDRRTIGTMTIARARMAEHPDEGAIEPAAWPVFARHFFNRTGIVLKVVDVELDEIGDADWPLVHAAGVRPYELSQAQRAAIDQYVHRGGTLLVETIGGRAVKQGGGFTQSIVAALNESFDAPPVTLSRKSPILTGQSLAGGYRVQPVRYRRHAVAQMGMAPIHRLAGYMINDRPAVIVSREDLSLGMLGLRHTNIIGYTPDATRKLVTNLLLRVRQVNAQRNEDVRAVGVAPD